MAKSAGIAGNDGSGGAETFPLELVFPDGPGAVSFPETDEAASLSFPRSFRLSLGRERAELLDLDSPKDGALFVDFAGGKLLHRVKYGGGRSQGVAKAVFSRMEPPHVFDATAGLGRDSFVLAWLGCTVEMFERNPVVRILLRDGLRRAAESGLLPWINERMILRDERTITELPDGVLCDVVYLDPMYPADGRQKKAEVKKDMRIFHSLVGRDSDQGMLLGKALRVASRRVSVKRPKGAPFLDGEKPDNMIELPGSRFDLYLPGEKRI